MSHKVKVANKRRSIDELREIHATVERLRDFIRLNYTTGVDVARRIGVRDVTVYSWMQDESRPSKPERTTAFFDNLPAEPNSGITPNGYEYREYKNWRGVSKPRRCPFCKRAKGEIRKVRGGYQGVCPNCGATGPKRDDYDDALQGVEWIWKDSTLNRLHFISEESPPTMATQGAVFDHKWTRWSRPRKLAR
jgi:hypothetical protein